MANDTAGTGLKNALDVVATGKATGISFLDFRLVGEFTVGNLIAVLVIAFVAFLVVKLVTYAIRHRLRGKVDPKNTDGLVKIVTWIIILIAFLVASPQLHLDLTGLLAAGGVLGIALGFASQNTLSNLVAGVMLILEHPFSFGDIVVIDGTEGYIEKISLISTHIKTYDGVILRIPNTTVFNARITNCVSNVARRFIYKVDISYADDAEKASAIIRGTVEKHPYALTEPAPDIYVDDLGAHGINVMIKIWAPSQYYWPTQHELLWEIFKALRDGGVDIPFNQLVLWYGEENAKKLCENIDNDRPATEILKGSLKEGKMNNE
ncbi:MAG TPA: mechanosensitive ion channel family protein [Methanocorpusculum sp.]|nr:mechanosensitive ion channel family protein [Methanocorpusculum sp.]